MAITRDRSKRKVTGGRYRANSKPKKRFLHKMERIPKVGDEIKKKIIRTHGGNQKVGLTSTNMANVIDLKTKKCKLVKIQTVVENNANLNYVRRNIITKGAVIKTELGTAKVTSRPGQDGIINAVLIEK